MRGRVPHSVLFHMASNQPLRFYAGGFYHFHKPHIMTIYKHLQNPDKEPEQLAKCGNSQCKKKYAIWKWSEMKLEWFCLCLSCRKPHWIPKHERELQNTSS